MGHVVALLLNMRKVPRMQLPNLPRYTMAILSSINLHVQTLIMPAESIHEQLVTELVEFSMPYHELVVQVF